MSDEIFKLKDTDPELWLALRNMNARESFEKALKRVATTAPPKNQKFKPGTLVLVAGYGEPDYGVVEYTYAHAYGGEDILNYCISRKYTDKIWRRCSWLNEIKLTELTDPKLKRKLLAEYTKNLKKITNDPK